MNEPTIRQLRANNTPDPVWAEAVAETLAVNAAIYDKHQREYAAEAADCIRKSWAANGRDARDWADLADRNFGQLWWVKACRAAELDGTR